jgi:hypothetical protein
MVDDDEQIRATQPHTIEAELEDAGIAACVIAVATVGEAEAALATEVFHCAIVDLRFLGHIGAGNEVLKTIVAKRLLPAIVYSAHPDELGDRFQSHQLISPVEAKDVDHVIAKIIEWNQTRVFDFFTEQGHLATQLRAAMLRTLWEHVSPRWSALQEELEAGELESIVTRLSATVVHDQLSSDPQFAGEAGEVCVHPGEIYVFHSPREYLAVGDILRLEDNLWVVLTPSCDLVARGNRNAKAKKVLLASCESFDSYAHTRREFGDELKRLVSDDAAAVENAKENMDRLMRHGFLNDDGRRFFLPPFAEIEGGVIDFTKLALQEYDRTARPRLVQARAFSLSPAISAELATRFSRYMNRLGQAPYRVESIVTAMEGVARRFTAAARR